MEIPGTNNRPGFHASEHTYPEVAVYQHSNDPLYLSATPFSSTKYDGRKQTDASHCVYSVTTQKSVGAASGSFQVLLKPSLFSESLFKQVMDDDWIDIVLYKGEKGYHIIRGLIDEVRRVRGVSGNGATTTYYSIGGRDFGKIWESTAIWFAPWASDLVSQSYSSQIHNGFPQLQRSPGLAPYVYLRNFMEEMALAGGVNWTPPLGMPGLNANTFTGNINFQDISLMGSIYFQNKPKRHCFNLNGLNPDGMAWDLAKECSDPAFTELYVDVLPAEGMLSPRIALGEAMPPLTTKMSVVLRDKPFPVLPDSAPPGYIPLWSQLPMHLLTRQEITSDDVGKSGYERYNSFYVTPRLRQEALGGNGAQLLAPLINRESVNRSGMRRLDVTSATEPDVSDPIYAGMDDPDVLAMYQRQFLRDWYCLNPYFLSGTITCGHGRPDIKIGNRLLIKGRLAVNPAEAEPDESYYVESVSHNWTAGSGMRTALGVTRGWLGSEVEYMAALTLMSKLHQLPPLAIVMP